MGDNAWPMVPLREVVDPVQRTILVEPDSTYRTLGVKWWGEGAYERQTIDGSQTAAKTLNEVRENDLIINKIWVRHGSVAVVPPEVAKCCGSNEFPTFEFRKDLISPRWMHWYSKTADLWSKCDALSQGTSGKNRIRPEMFLTVTIPLPSLDEQNRIVSRIDRIAEMIGNAHKISRQLEIEYTSFLRSKFSRLVEDSPRVALSDIASLARRSVIPKPGQEYAELGVRSFGRGTFHKPPLDYMSVGTKKLFRIEPGDLVFSNVFAWEGAIAVAQPENVGRVGSHRFITYVPNPKHAVADFLCFYFLTPEGLERIGEASPGGAGRNRTLGLSKLAAIEVPLPSIDSQHAFVRHLKMIRRVSDSRESIKTDLTALLPSTLDRAFNGEL
jgi:type I restriction enzyme S subunit